MLLIFLVFSYLSAQEISTTSFISKSFYDIGYLNGLISTTSSDCEVMRSTYSSSILLNLKKNNLTRSEIASALVCICEKEKSYYSALEVSKKKKTLIEILQYYDCNYKVFRYKGLKLKKMVENIDDDRKTLKDIVFRYFRK
ncbi:MAG: hypothetical protein ACP5IO_04180 [Elusimicrobiales bacterium]